MTQKVAHGGETVAAPPWAHTDRFTLFDANGRPTHSHLPTTLGELWETTTSAQLPQSGNVYRYTQPWLFLHAHTAYTARVQHLTRANALPTAHWRIKYGFRSGHTTCDLCATPGTDADVRHVLIHCAGVTDLRDQFLTEATRIMTAKTKLLPGSAEHGKHRALIEALIHDNELWINGQALFYKGEMPGLFEYDDDNLTNLYNALSGLCMMTAARIWARHVHSSRNYERQHGARATPTTPHPKRQRAPPQTRPPDLRRGRHTGQRHKPRSNSEPSPDNEGHSTPLDKPQREASPPETSNPNKEHLTDVADTRPTIQQVISQSDTIQQPRPESDWEIDPVHGFGNPNIVEEIGDIMSDDDPQDKDGYNSDNSDDLYYTIPA